jgi:NADH:ubiquinone oxidoreductase subunit 2 (subunit N)
MLMSLCIWGIFLSLRLKFNNSLVLNLINFNSLMVINSFLTIIFSLMFLAMAGIPLLPGF